MLSDAAERTKGDPTGRTGQARERPFTERLVTAATTPRVGVAVLVASAIGFAVLAVLAVFDEGALLAIDEPIQRWIVDHRVAWLDGVMKAVTFLGSRYAVGVLVLAVAIWTYRAGKCRVTLLILVLAFILNPVVEFAFKELIIERTRPQLASIALGRGASFPSGHVLVAVGFYAMLPAMVAETHRRYRLQLTAAIGAGVLIVAIGVSRVYVGVHWFTDVVGGIFLGSVIVLATYGALRGHRLDPTRCRPLEDPDAATGHLIALGDETHR